MVLNKQFTHNGEREFWYECTYRASNLKAHKCYATWRILILVDSTPELA